MVWFIEIYPKGPRKGISSNYANAVQQHIFRATQATQLAARQRSDGWMREFNVTFAKLRPNRKVGTMVIR